MARCPSESALVPPTIPCDANRHPANERLCDLMASVLRGDQAAALLASGVVEPGGPDVAVVAARVYAWSHAGVPVGAKDRDTTTGASAGARLLLPVRVEWQHGPVMVLREGEFRSVRYVGAGLGTSFSGTAEVMAVGHDRSDPAVARPSAWASIAEPAPAWLNVCDGASFECAPVYAPPMAASRAKAVLERLAAVGREARWELLGIARDIAELHAPKLHAHLSLRNTGSVCADVLDTYDIEAAIQTVVLGDPDCDGPSRTWAMYDRLMAPDGVTRCDPLREITRSVRRDLYDTLSSRMGDTKQGERVRQLAARLGTRDVDVLADAYRELYGATLRASTIRRAITSPFRHAEPVDLTDDATAALIEKMAGDVRVGSLRDQYELRGCATGYERR